MCFGGVYFGFVLLKPARTQPTSTADITRKKRIASPPVGSKDPTENDRLRAFQKTDFYRTIVDNNLFRPLGWRPPRPREPYRLLGTLIPTDANTPKQAILQRTTSERIATVSIGEALDSDTTVTDIQSKQVTLETNGKQRTLHLNTTPLLK